MKKLLLVTSALVLAGQASAADLPIRMPVKAPVVAAVPYSWTSCYVGGHAGAGWDRTTFSDPNGETIANVGDSIGVNGRTSALGGIQTGCDYQFANRWVVGLAGDFSWTNIRGAGIDPFFENKNGGPITLNPRTDTLASITGRVGYAWDNFLLYGKGGAAFAHNSYSLHNLVQVNGVDCPAGGGAGIICNATGSTNRTGWTVGAGFEWAFARNWSAMVEYDHYGFGNKGVSFTDPNTPSLAVINIKQSVDVVKAGINYRFSP
jgi:outer membrane immunogenic protein